MEKLNRKVASDCNSFTYVMKIHACEMTNRINLVNCWFDKFESPEWLRTWWNKGSCKLNRNKSNLDRAKVFFNLTFVLCKISLIQKRRQICKFDTPNSNCEIKKLYDDIIRWLPRGNLDCNESTFLTSQCYLSLLSFRFNTLKYPASSERVGSKLKLHSEASFVPKNFNSARIENRRACENSAKRYQREWSDLTIELYTLFVGRGRVVVSRQNKLRTRGIYSL